jgi:hypothetical protein
MGGACVVVVVVTACVVVVVVGVGGGVVVVGGVLPVGGGSDAGELDVGELVVALEVVVSDDEVVVSVDGVVGDVGDVEPLVSEDVAVDVPESGATTTGSGIGGGGAPGGRVALASLASTLTVSSCHWLTNSCFCSTSSTVATVVVSVCNLFCAASH